MRIPRNHCRDYCLFRVQGFKVNNTDMNMINKFPNYEEANTNNMKDERVYLEVRENNVIKLKSRRLFKKCEGKVKFS